MQVVLGLRDNGIVMLDEDRLTGTQLRRTLDSYGENLQVITLTGTINPQDTDSENLLRSLKYIETVLKHVEVIDMGALDVSGAVSMRKMLKSCRSLAKCILPHGTDSVKSLYGLFEDCWALRVIGTSHFDTSGVEDVGGMLYRCGALTSFDASRLDVRNVWNMVDLFGGCLKLREVNLTGWQLDSLVHAEGMFSGCPSLRRIVASKETVETLKEHGAWVPEQCRIVEPGLRREERGWRREQERGQFVARALSGYLAEPLGRC